AIFADARHACLNVSLQRESGSLVVWSTHFQVLVGGTGRLRRSGSRAFHGEHGLWQSWLSARYDRTFWPQVKNPNKHRRMVIEGATPSPDWSQARCVVKFWTDDYEMAHEKMGVLEYGSDLNSEKELGRGKRKRRCALPSDYESDQSGSSDSTGSDGDYLPPRPPQMRKHAEYFAMLVSYFKCDCKNAV
ncbi:unnamed protein product, partial [Ixodes pacificus]